MRGGLHFRAGWCIMGRVMLSGGRTAEGNFMNIVIIGSGTVGAAICAQLEKEGHDVTVIDHNPAPLAELSGGCDVISCEGNGADVSVLRRAGAERADLLIAVTSQDEINILCCAAARKLGTRHTIARVRNPAYSELMNLMQKEMNLSLTINPELAAAGEIYRTLRFPSAAKIETFCHGKVEMAEFVVGAHSPIAGVTLNDLRARLNLRFLVCGVLRGEDAYIPSGDFILQAGDAVCVTAPDEEITQFFKAIGVYRKPVKDVLIVGGGRTVYYLLEMLRNAGIRATVIEKDKQRCHALAEQYSCTVICDDGSRQELLREEGIATTDAFLALSDVDEENAIISLYAKTQGVEKVITMISAMPYVDFFKGVGLESVVSPKSSTTSTILRYVRSMANAHDSEIESLYRIMEGRIEALEFVVKEEIAGLTGVPLRELHCRAGVLIACIVGEGGVLIPTGGDCIRCGDTVIVISSRGQMNSIKDIL